jgi:hypothetical protein
MSGVLTLMLDVERRRSAVESEGAWGREARAVLAAASRRGVALAEASLIYYDVRDLQALRHRLESDHDDRALRRVLAA